MPFYPSRGFRLCVSISIAVIPSFLPLSAARSGVGPAAGRALPAISLPDMARFLPQHDLVYERAPERWLDGIPLAIEIAAAQVRAWANGNETTPTFHINGTIVVDFQPEKLTALLL